MREQADKIKPIVSSTIGKLNLKLFIISELYQFQ